MNITYKGFNTISESNMRNFKLYDIELVKRDLLNHFYTRRGERIGRPEFGCIIWDYLMDTMTPGIVGIIRDDAKRICESDPRLVLNSVSVDQDNHSIIVSLNLTYKPFDVSETMRVEFNNEQR